MVTHTLRETIYIDFDEIEASTLRRCQCEDIPLGPPSGRLGSEHDFDMTHRSRQAQSGGFFEHAVPSETLAPHGQDMAEGARLENEADKMLEQAESLPIDMDFQDLLFSDYTSDGFVYDY